MRILELLFENANNQQKEFVGYHGSPRYFEDFDSSKISSNVGARFGWGFYFAASPRSAGTYSTIKRDHDWLHAMGLLKRGYLYQVSLTVDPDKIMRWHGRLSEQPFVKTAFIRISKEKNVDLRNPVSSLLPEQAGTAFLNLANRLESFELATELLLQKNIKMIIAGTTTSPESIYVALDKNIIKINEILDNNRGLLKVFAGPNPRIKKISMSL